MTLRSARPRAFRLVIIGCAALAIGGGRAPVAAQSLVFTTIDDATLGLQLKNPSLPLDDAPSRWSSTLETDLLFRWGANVFVQATLPMAFAGADFVDGTSFYVGALGATFIFGPPGSPSSFLGITLPTASNLAGPDLAVLIAVLPNEDEPELWAEDIMSVRGGITPFVQLSEEARVGLRVGGALLAPDDLGDLWLYGRGAVWGSTRLSDAELRGDLVTSYFINSSEGFAEQLRMYLDARAGLPEAPGRPAVFLRLPVDGEARDALDFSVGLSARIGL
jgi:hypothetical protein